MHTNAELRDAALVAADIIADIDRLGVHVASVRLGGFGSDIVIQVASAFDRAVVAAALDLLTVGEPYGEAARPLLENTGALVHDFGEFRVAVYGPAHDREPAAAVKAGA